MNLLQITILAVVQGLTEFLPISSSGHLVIGAKLLAPSGSPKDFDILEVNIVLHVGTLLAILVFYWHRIWRLFGEDRRVIILLVVGTIPAVAVGLPLEKYAEAVLENPWLAGCMLPVTGAMLLFIPYIKLREGRYAQMSVVDALWIGVFQAFAILPGISRSGSTITAGLARGLSRESAAAFSFLLAIPAIAGGGVLKVVKSLSEASHTTPIGHLAIGAAVAFVVGLAALWLLVKWLEQGRLQNFAYYCIGAGLASIVWQVWRLYG